MNVNAETDEKGDFWPESKLTSDKGLDLYKKQPIRSAQCNSCHLPDELQQTPLCIALNIMLLRKVTV